MNASSYKNAVQKKYKKLHIVTFEAKDAFSKIQNFLQKYFKMFKEKKKENVTMFLDSKIHENDMPSLKFLFITNSVSIGKIKHTKHMNN